MIYSIIFVVILFLIVNSPGYIRKNLVQEIAEESSRAKDSSELAQWNPLSKIEWLRFYPLKKVLFGVLWIVCLFVSVRGIFMYLLVKTG